MPNAKKFKRWVTSEVLPSIRGNGAYIAGQENMTPEQIMAAGLQVDRRLSQVRTSGSKYKESVRNGSVEQEGRGNAGGRL